jgi:hypothetical protein
MVPRHQNKILGAAAMGSSMRCEEPGGSTPSGLRTGVRLFDFVSGWFDEHRYYEF